MAVINPADLTFNGQEVREFAECIFEELYANPVLDQNHLIVEDIVAKQQIAIFGHLSKITKKDPGCGLGKVTKNIPMSEKFWNPVQLKIWLSECHNQFDATFMVYYKKKGKEYPDLTVTEIFSQWLVEEVSQAAAEDILRIVYFSDTAAKKIADGGVFSASVDLTDYDHLNGFFKQAFAIVAANSKQRVTIAKNAGASYAAQTFDDNDTTNRVATKILQNLIWNADIRFRNDPNFEILATRSLADQYAKERLNNDKLETVYHREESGIESIMVLGKKVFIYDIWDRTIQADQDNGTKWNLPHRALAVSKNNMQIGFDEDQAYGDFDVFYDKMTETSNIKGGYKADAVIVEDFRLMFAY
ncbi:hypothetical protein BCY91_14130 [Pelobium manganitolerans]|uniref:Phage capsid protein n=1 Tax=Pelobium manganitolerans TaxID=1842495 RepID=A0A419SAH0_9SPHI|nr:hypothetical protein [Pelobium manganitolerans]RKD19011.1 hypothetical protein BCY91_14130 [Pelobium manganitolerans]